MNEWISIKSERPPRMEMVIFYDGENVWPGWDTSSQDGEEFAPWCADPAFESDELWPTHWMFLPEFPS